MRDVFRDQGDDFLFIAADPEDLRDHLVEILSCLSGEAGTPLDQLVPGSPAARLPAVSPIDLDVLSEELCRRSGRTIVTMISSLAEAEVDDDAEFHTVSPEIVRAVAELEEADLDDVARAFAEVLDLELGEDDPRRHAARVAGIRDFGRVCREARTRGLAVILIAHPGSIEDGLPRPAPSGSDEPVN